MHFDKFVIIDIFFSVDDILIIMFFFTTGYHV